MKIPLRYPIYIISKNRSHNCLTPRSLDRLGIPYKVVIEPHEFNEYSDVIDSDKLLTLPFDNIGMGSTPARNWVWEHSIKCGNKKHWILDDNIEDFNRLNKNTKFKVRTNATFRACEDFTDRYKNVAMSGMNYYNFCKATDKVPPFYLNTRIYSCILIQNDIPYRWRGKYNEDTDLSLRVLKHGWCTILFNAFLCGKVTTMRMSGGNTDNVYNDTDNRREFAESLRKQHPDLVKVVWRFNRWHHQVNYKPFKENRLLINDNLKIPKSVNNYGMKLVNKNENISNI